MAPVDPPRRSVVVHRPRGLAEGPRSAGHTSAAPVSDGERRGRETLREARRADGGQVHLLSALDTSTRIVLAQVTVSATSNEIPAFTPLLDAVEQVLGTLTGPLFIADALHTQTAHAEEIAARGAHLMIPTKGNQPTLFKQLKTLPWPEIPIGDRRWRTARSRFDLNHLQSSPGSLNLAVDKLCRMSRS
ncbi:transposase [Micromonospora sp. NPDC005171]|uniref:transposase n=1 Tax=Micromonospora sp. NPDC005171 TaxID=3156866 RepID=UPI0033AECCDA